MQDSKRQVAEEIDEGLTEWHQAPKSKEGRHPELFEQFTKETTEKPMQRKDIETEAANFIKKHFGELLPLMLRNDQNFDQDKIIRQLKLTNEDIAILGGAVFYL
ncbi:MAG: hypothetical protein WCT11_02490 [Candidatus Magasanikbacteria bacterium]